MTKLTPSALALLGPRGILPAMDEQQIRTALCRAGWLFALTPAGVHVYTREGCEPGQPARLERTITREEAWQALAPVLGQHA